MRRGGRRARPRRGRYGAGGHKPRRTSCRSAPAVPRSECGTVDHGVILAAPGSKALARAERLRLGHVMPRKTRQSGEQVACQCAEEALDEGLGLGRIGWTRTVLDLQVGQYAKDMARGVVVALIRAHRLRHAPLQDAAPQQRRDRRGPAGRYNQHPCLPAPDIDRGDDGVAPAVGADHIGRRAVQLP